MFVEEDGATRGADVVSALTKRRIEVATVAIAHGLDPRDLAPVLFDLPAPEQRMVVIGDGAGADVVLSLPAHASIAALIGLSGTYASVEPRADAPPVLLLSGAKDDPTRAQGARRLARALEARGAKGVESYLVPEHDADELLRWDADDALTALVVGFVTRGPEKHSIDGPFGAKQIWGRDPPLAYPKLWEKEVVTRPIDAAFMAALEDLFEDVTFELHPWPLREYHAIPIEKLGTGEWLVTTNIRGEQLTLSKKDITEHQPVLVIGIDDEKNLYRLFTRYRVNQEYSWKPREAGAGPMPLMIRPVGPFLFFPKGAPAHLRDTTLATFALESFDFEKDDPLASVRKLSPVLRATLTGNDGCLKCHSLRGAGAHAHHVRALDGKAHGGFALPLEEYRPDVLRRFLFEQEAVAAGFGVAPLNVPPDVRTALFDLARTGDGGRRASEPEK